MVQMKRGARKEKEKAKKKAAAAKSGQAESANISFAEAIFDPKKMKRLIKDTYAARPRSCLELFYFIRDDIVLTPRFQWFWWWTGCCFVCFEYALQMSGEFCLMILMCYALFTLPCLRFCKVWTALYQERRNAQPPEEEPEEEKPPKQKKKKAMTEEEMLEATRKRQKNRPGEGDSKSFNPTKKKKQRGAKKLGNVPQEDNVGGVISELQIKTVK